MPYFDNGGYDNRSPLSQLVENTQDCVSCGGQTREQITRSGSRHICLQRRGPCGVRIRILKDQYGRRVNRVVFVKTHTTSDGHGSRYHSRFYFDNNDRYDVLSDRLTAKVGQAETVRRSLRAESGRYTPRLGASIFTKHRDGTIQE